MALVNFLKFSKDKGAIIADEEYWNVFFRKRMHGDNLHSLLDPELASKWNMQVVYGSVGYPSIHKEVVQNTMLLLREQFESSKTRPKRVKDIARIAFDQLQEAIRKRIDQKMVFYYGFSTDDLNQGKFDWNGSTYSIAAGTIKEEAQKLASRETKDTLLKSVLDAKAAVFGYDNEGITGYYLSADNSILGYIHEGFEAIGSGKYASGLVFGQDFKTKTLQMRQDGYPVAEGIFELINSAYQASEHFKEVGGTLHIVILDRSQKKTHLQYREIFDREARLAAEIVKAQSYHLITKEQAVGLLNSLVCKNSKPEHVEEDLFKKSSDKIKLHFILRRYKEKEASELATVIPSLDFLMPLNRKGVKK